MVAVLYYAVETFDVNFKEGQKYTSELLITFYHVRLRIRTQMQNQWNTQEKLLKLETKATMCGLKVTHGQQKRITLWVLKGN